MQNEVWTQTELLKHQFDNASEDIIDGLLPTGVYMLVGTSKIGKSIIANELANAVATDTSFMGKKVSSGKVIYFDNDNYASETKNRIHALQLQPNDHLIYNFKDANSFTDIEEYLRNHLYSSPVKLLIIDCLANISEIEDTDNFKSNYAILKNFCSYCNQHNLCCIIIHHSRKGKNTNQDSVLGSRSLTSAITGTILIDVKNDFSTKGHLKFILRSKKEIIPICKCDNNISWQLDSNPSEIDDESIDTNVLKVIHTLVREKTNQLEGNCQELCEKMNLDINPQGLYRFLERNKEVLNTNHISFERCRNRTQRFIKLKITSNE